MSARNPFDFAKWLLSNPNAMPANVKTLRLLLGSIGADAVVVSRTIAYQTGSKWPTLVTFTYRTVYLTWESASLTLRNFDVASIRGMIGVAWEFRSDEVAGRIIKLLEDASPRRNLSQLGREGVRSLVGYRWISLDDILNALGISARMTEEEALAIVTRGSHSFEQNFDAAQSLLTKLFDVRGISAFSASVLQRSGYEHGARLEVRSLIVKLMQGVLPSKLRMAVPMLDGKMGVDIIQYVDDGIEVVADLFQAKAVKDIGALIGPRGSSETLRQFWSDLRRFGEPMMKTGPESFVPMPGLRWRVAAAGKEATGNIADMVRLSGRYVFELDYDHFVDTVPDAIAMLTRRLEQFGIDVDDVFDPRGALAQLGLAMADRMNASVASLTDITMISGPFLDFMADHLNTLGKELPGWTDVTLTGPNAIAASDLLGRLRQFNLIDDAIVQQVGALAGDAPATLQQVVYILNRNFSGFTDAMLAGMPKFVVEFQVIYKSDGINPGGVLNYSNDL